MAMFDRFKKKGEAPDEGMPEIPPLPELPPLPETPGFGEEDWSIPHPAELPRPEPSRQRLPEPEPLQLPRPEPQMVEMQPRLPGPPPMPKRLPPIPPQEMPKPSFVPRPRVEMPEITPPRRPPMVAVKPHIFMKIDRYKEILNTVERLKAEIVDIKKNVKDIEELDMRGSEKVKTAETIIDKISELVEFFEKSFSTPEE